MLNGFLMCGLSTSTLLGNSLLPYRCEIIGSVILADIYWIIPCTHPFPKLFVVEFSSIVFPNPSIRRVAINNITFFMLIILVVKRGEVNLLFCGNIKVLKTVHSFKALYHIMWKSNNPVVKCWLSQFQPTFVYLVKAFLARHILENSIVLSHNTLFA